MLVRHGQRTDPGGLEQRLRSLGVSANQAAAVSALPDNHGMLVVLDHVGLLSVPEPLVIRAVVGQGDADLWLSDEERERGVRLRNKRFGAVVIWAKGPGTHVIDTWAALPLPADFAALVAPGGVAVMGLVLPAHAPDRPIPAPASLATKPGEGDQWQAHGPLEVFWDLDALGRAALADYLPGVLTRTLIRATGKQAVVAAGAEAAREEGNNALAFLINLFGSAIMTLTEDADIRAWSTLPDHVGIKLVDLPAGEHSLQLQAQGSTIQLDQVQIRPGQITIVPVYRPGAMLPGNGTIGGLSKQP